ncbi:MULTISPECIES: hypothetical protein [unclassified Lentilitoribacter]|uniref:hypothetical protein n=1 Tax=unclassified Lentilitoribacter TaxID=2647570 RepID=UPI0013A6DC58|nr:hypothetical protein [Lentilitoribacter sp. Alg239-R112]
MSVQTIQVSSSAAIDSAVTGYLNQGFTVANRTDTKAIMQKNKAPLSAAMIILGLIVPIFGWAFLIGYLIIHGSKPASQVIEINLAAEDS